MDLSGKHVVLGITGGIAAYRAADIARALTKRGARVHCILTKNATHFITRQTMETLTGCPAVVDMFERPATMEVEHIALAKQADVFLVAPASANFLGKVAAGVADDMLTTTIMATRAPIVIAPAMNTNMYESPVTQRNLRTLRELLHVNFVEPAVGLLACNDVGKGHIASNEEILSAVERALAPKDLSGCRVLVTAGPTREKIDPVRYITNRSSGRMGYALAEAAAQRGAQVTLVSGPVALDCPYGVERVFVESTQDLFDAMARLCPAQDVIVQAAAPADYRPAQPAAHKIKKQDGAALELLLTENPDVAAMVGERRRPDQVLVAFAAETDDLRANAHRKLTKKHADLLVGNDVTKPGAGFDVETNIVTLFDGEGEEPLPMLPKREVAERILDRCVRLLKQKRAAET